MCCLLLPHGIDVIVLLLGQDVFVLLMLSVSPARQPFLPTLALALSSCLRSLLANMLRPTNSHAMLCVVPLLM